jgi:Zinc-binding dehydrogenase
MFEADIEKAAYRVRRSVTPVNAGLNRWAQDVAVGGCRHPGFSCRGGQDVLVNGATGAIGSAAVQLLKQLGARLTAVCGPEHLELVKGLGADRVIDYTGQDFTRDTQRYDLVLVLTFITPLGGGKKVMMNLGGTTHGWRAPSGRCWSRGVSAAGRPAVSAGGDRRGLPVRRDGTQDRQRRDQHRAFDVNRCLVDRHLC